MLWREAEVMSKSEEALERQAAFDLYFKACSLQPDPRRLTVTTQFALEFERAEELIDLLEKAARVEPLNLDLKWSLAQCYEAQKDITNARRYVEEMLSYDPAEPRALRFYKRYR